MLKKFFRREKPRVYLGVLAVATRSDFKRNFDQWGMFRTEDLDMAMRQSLSEIFSLPSVQDIDEPKDSDIGLDVVIPKFQSGDAWNLSLGDFGIPLLWRPKVTISSRFYYVKSEKTKEIFSITEKMRWGQYFRRLLTWRAFLRLRPVFDGKDMEYLLYKAFHKLLLKMQKNNMIFINTNNVKTLTQS